MAPVDVNRVIERMDDLLRHTIGGAVQIETVLSPEVNYGLCDANQLENAVINLAVSARDAMPGGGTLTLSTKPTGKGTGLGLAQFYGIARQSGGTLRIESAAGKGTIIHLLLPQAAGSAAKDGGQKPDVAAPERAGASIGGTVLLIDDDADVRNFLTDSLQGLGHQVIAAQDGMEGLEKLAGVEPDLVLLNYAMPVMHGAEVARAIRKRHPALPIVFVTGYAESEQMDAAMGAEAAILRKAFSMAELAECSTQSWPAAAAETLRRLQRGEFRTRPPAVID